jgi:iron complex outermembrane receptor protein
MFAVGWIRTARADSATPPQDLSELPLEKLLDIEIYSASRFAQKAREAPSSARVITAAEIRAHGWRTLSEALDSLPGLFTSYDRTYTYLGARGFLRPGDYDGRFLLLVDGMRVNDPTYDQAPIGTDFLVDMDLVERIEYVPGPGSAAFGSNAFFGVINVITRDGRDVPGLRAAAGLGTLGQRDAHVQYAATDGADRDLLLAAGRMHGDGATLHFPEFESTGNGVARGLDGIELDRFFGKANFGDLTVMLAYASQTKDDPTASYGQLFGDPRSKARDTRTIADIAYHGSIADDLDGSVRLFSGRYDYFGSYVYAPAPGPLNRDTATARWFGASAQVVYTGWEGHKLLLGFDGQRDSQRDLANYDIDPYVSYIDSRGSNTHLAPFVEDEFSVRDDLRVNAGFRYDRTSANGTDTSPRLALIYTPTPTTILKALFGRAYRAPNAYESAYAELGAASGFGDGKLDSERVRTTELVWSQRIDSGTTLTTSVFRYDIRDLINQVVADAASDLLVFENDGRVKDQGFEVALDRAWDNGATLRASYSFADVDDVGTDGSSPKNAPAHLLKLDASAPLGSSGVLLGVEARYVGRRRGETAWIDAYSVVDATLTWPVVKDRLELALTVKNLFGERYGDPPGPGFVQNAIPQDGRTALLRANWRF